MHTPPHPSSSSAQGATAAAERPRRGPAVTNRGRVSKSLVNRISRGPSSIRSHRPFRDVAGQPDGPPPVPRPAVVGGGGGPHLGCPAGPGQMTSGWWTEAGSACRVACRRPCACATRCHTCGAPSAQLATHRPARGADMSSCMVGKRGVRGRPAAVGCQWDRVWHERLWAGLMALLLLLQALDSRMHQLWAATGIPCTPSTGQPAAF